MPRAEVGSTKYVANKMKSKGLQRLRWYCQACNKQCRDENGFKCHTQSESHVRQMMLIGENPNAHIQEYSQEFRKAFISQLKTAHGSKSVPINRFYQEYIQFKEHIHMNATQWKSLTEFAKSLGREGICRVEETDKGLHIAWIDNSPEAMKRQAAIQKQERMEKNDEDWEKRMLQRQIARAQQEAKQEADDQRDDAQTPQKWDGQKISLSLGMKPKASKLPTPPEDETRRQEGLSEKTAGDGSAKEITPPSEEVEKDDKVKPVSFKMSMGTKSAAPKRKNVFAEMRTKKAPRDQEAAPLQQSKKMSEAERIMQEEMAKSKERRSGGFGNPAKKPRLG